MNSFISVQEEKLLQEHSVKIRMIINSLHLIFLTNDFDGNQTFQNKKKSSLQFRSKMCEISGDRECYL